MKQLVPRKFERKRFLAELSVRGLPRGSPFRVSALNVGQGGLALFARQFVAVGQPVELALPISSAASPSSSCTLEGRVTYARAEPEGNIIGIAFAKPLSAQELEALEVSLGAKVRR